MTWTALITSIVLTVLLAAPFQWFLGAGNDTFIRRDPSPGAVWGSWSFLSGIAAIAWVGLLGGLPLDSGTVLALVLAAAAVTLYEWARRTVGRKHLYIGLTDRVPEAVTEAGPYRHLRHAFYLSYLIAFAAVALAMRSRLGTGVALANGVLFFAMALHDERVLARSPLAGAYADYRRRVGILLLLPRRASGQKAPAAAD